MIGYIAKRFGHMLNILIIVSIVTFVLIELPPGDYLSHYESALLDKQMNAQDIQAELDFLKRTFGLDRPIHMRYLKWVRGFFVGDLGWSLRYRDKIGTLVKERILLTLAISFGSLVFAMLVAIPIGVFSAVRQYSPGDYIFTFVGFLGLATPNFLLALVLMFVAVFFFNASSVGGLFSQAFIGAPWSLARVIDLAKHIWVPIIVVGTAGTAGAIRVMRAQMLGALKELHINTARMKGVAEPKVIWKHAFRAAVNPMISGLGMSLPDLISGESITSIVLILPTVGPLLLNGLLAQDMWLAATILLMLTGALLIGNLIADLALAWVDPRIRVE